MGLNHPMKKRILLLTAAICAILVVIQPSAPAHGNGSGAPTGYTGSPNEFSGRTCGTGGGCHGGGVTFQNSWITSDIPDCGFTPGATYTINVFVTQSGRTKFGFSCSPQYTTGGATAGTLVAGTGMQLNGSGRYITHTSSGTAQNGTNSRTWSFQWIAPANPTGPVTFYASMNATNSSNTNTGDIIYNSNLSVSPVQTLSIQNSGGTTICSSSPVTLTSSISGGNVWTLNGQPAGSSNSISASASGTYELTNTAGACVQTQSITLTASSGLPVVTPINVSVEGTSLCPGESTTLSTNLSGVTWQPGGQTTSSIVVNQAGSYTYSQTNACGTSTSEAVVVTTTSLPETPTLTGSDIVQFCAGTSVDVEVISSESVIWSPGGETTTSVSLDEAGDYTVVATNVCGESPALSLSLIEIDIPETPGIEVSGETEFCAGEEVTLTATNGTMNDVAMWEPSGVSAISIVVNESGTYAVSFTNQCGTGDQESIEILVFDLPQTPVITLDGDGALDAGVAGSDFIWYLNGVEIMNETDSLIIPLSVGNYTVQAISDDGCTSALSEAFNYNPTSLNILANEGFDMYPNPSNGDVFIRRSSDFEATIVLFDLSGRTIREYASDAFNNGMLRIQVPAGHYLVKSGNLTKKLIVLP